MRKLLIFFCFVNPIFSFCQPAIITSWLENTEGTTGSHYISGNPNLIVDNVEANVQLVQYSDNWVYVHTNGIPAYPTGPFLDGNPSQAQDQNAIFKISRNPQQNTGTPTATTPGNIGVFINGVALFDYRDGVSWRSSTNSLAGGPLGGMGDNVWNRDAVLAEREGFDCSKGHPAMGNYHHHQNPSAFSLDLNVISNVCDIYAADGLYSIQPNEHSPLLGFAYDGYPIYGAYAYKNTDGTGEIVRMLSSYFLRSITERTHYANGNDVTDGPPVNSTYPLGYFREDYEFMVPFDPSQGEWLDEHNGRWCITPEFPEGTYAYFCTVDQNWNSAYPYAVGPTFYGVKTASKVNSVTETVTNHIPTYVAEKAESENLTIFFSPLSEAIIVQKPGINPSNMTIQLFNMEGKKIKEVMLKQGSNLSYIDTRDVYNGTYIVTVAGSNNGQKIILQR